MIQYALRYVVCGYPNSRRSASQIAVGPRHHPLWTDALDEKQKLNKFRNLLHAMSTRDKTKVKSGGLHKGRWVDSRTKDLER